MTKLLIIAGPQSSGKTTVFNYLKNKYPNFHFLEEINPYMLFGKNNLGGAFINYNMELKIINADLQILKELNRQKLNHTRAIIMETGIFHLIYAEKFCGKKITADLYKKYLALHKNFNCINIFIDTKPEISWRRRYPNYLKRVDNHKDHNLRLQILEKYQKTIYDLYPLWLKWYKKIPFEKVMMKNSFKSKGVFLTQVDTIIKNRIEKL